MERPVAVAGPSEPGEVVAQGDPGAFVKAEQVDRAGLREIGRQREAVLVPFDLLGMDGADLRPLPLLGPRRRLAAILAGGPDALLFSSNVEAGQGEALFRHACAMNLEGTVSKRLEAPYRSGLSQTWRKIKCPGYSRP